MEIKVIPRRWGSSIAVIIPREVVEREKIKENKEITISLKNRPLAGNFFGKFPRNSNRTAQEIKDELREGWLSSSDREKEEQWKKKLKMK